jgi:YbbR domain-containing protein
MKSKVSMVLATMRALFIRNLPLKLLSLLFAILLWSFVIYSNPSITRDKILSDVEVTTSGQTVLAGRNLALLTNTGAELPYARVRVQAPQASLASVTAEMVRVEIDLSSIRQSGKQTVKLRGVSSTGRVTQIWPDAIDLLVEEMDQRYAPVNIELTGKDPNYWYNPIASKINPTQIVLTGPASIVRQVSSALVQIDVQNMHETFNRSGPFTLLDGLSQELDATMLTKSTGSVTVSVEVYPAKQLKISDNVQGLLTGDLPDGYELEGVVIQPDTITVAGEQALLDAMYELTVEPINVKGQKSTFSELRKIDMLDNFKYKSSEQVTVTVNIREKNITERFSGIAVTLVGKSSDRRATLSVPRVDVRANGRYTNVKALKKGDILASIDISNLADGTYSLPVRVVADNYPDVQFSAEPAQIEVTITGSKK